MTFREKQENIYQDLIQVRPAINYLEASAFTAGLVFPVDGWNSLRPYRIGFVRGMKLADVNTEGMNRAVASNYKALFKMLDHGRVEVAVLLRVNGLFQQIKLGFANVHELKPPHMRINLFHYLHRKHQDLVPRLSTVIREMEQKGELAAMRERATQILLESAATSAK